MNETTTSLFRERSKKEHVKYKLLMKVSEVALREYAQDTGDLANVRFVASDQLTTPSEMIIYGTKVALISFQPTLLATVIDNKDINQTFNQIFDYIWETTKSYHDTVVKKLRTP